MKGTNKLSSHFTVGEVAYHARDGKTYYPDAHAFDMLRMTCTLILEPMREAYAAKVHETIPIYILSGGGYDPLYDASGKWISHRSSKTTQHHHGGAIDFRIGVKKAVDWDIQWAYQFVLDRLEALGIEGGVGLYADGKNLFVHIDLRQKRARW